MSLLGNADQVWLYLTRPCISTNVRTRVLLSSSQKIFIQSMKRLSIIFSLTPSPNHNSNACSFVAILTNKFQIVDAVMWHMGEDVCVAFPLDCFWISNVKS